MVNGVRYELADLLLLKLVHLCSSKRQDLVDVFQSIGITAECEVNQRDTESGDVLDRKIRPSLEVSLSHWKDNSCSP